MGAWLLRRLVGLVLLLGLIAFLSYALIGLMPGDPIDQMIASNPDLTTEDAQRLKALYGLDQPLTSRFVAWAGGALTGDFGYSRLYGAPALEVLWPAFGRSLLLMGLSLVLATALALPAAVFAAAKPDRWLDRSLNLFAFAGISLPSFWLGLILVLVFAVTLGWLPAGGTGQLEGGGFVNVARHLVLPVVTLALLTFGVLFRFARSAMLEALAQDFVRTARAKGVSRAGVLWRHALPNAMLPIVTVLALNLGGVISGSLVVETVFAYRGMGRIIYDAIMGNDFNLALAGLMLAAAAALLANLLADLLYVKLDPRVDFA